MTIDKITIKLKKTLSPVVFIGSSCRTRVLKHLKKKFTLSEAEEHFGVNYFQSHTTLKAPPSIPASTPLRQNTSNLQEDWASLSPLFRNSPSAKALRSESPLGEAIPRLITLFKEQMSSRMRQQLINFLFKIILEQEHGLKILHFFNGDCLNQITRSILTLYKAGKENIIYQFANVIAENKMDMERMPFGLIDYNIRFFNAKNTVKLKMEDHYAMWQETMFAHFGHKWVSLNRGPMWQYDEEVQDVTKSNVGCDILAEAPRSSGVHMDDDIDVHDISKLVPEFESVSSSVVGHEAEAFTQNEEDDDLVPVSGLSADTCFVVEEDMSLLCEHREVSLCECEDVADEEPEHVVVSPASNEASAAVQSHGSEPVAVSTLWSSLSGADIEEIHESSDSPFLVEQLHGVTPQKHTVKNHSALYKPEKVNIVIAAKMWLHSKIHVPSF